MNKITSIQVMKDYFYPDEPLSRALGFGQPGGENNRLMETLAYYINYHEVKIKFCANPTFYQCDSRGVTMKVRLGPQGSVHTKKFIVRTFLVQSHLVKISYAN